MALAHRHVYYLLDRPIGFDTKTRGHRKTNLIGCYSLRNAESLSFVPKHFDLLSKCFLGPNKLRQDLE